MVNTFQFWLERRLYDKDWRLEWVKGPRPSRSFVKQWLQHIECTMEDANRSGVLDKDNNSRTILSPTGGSQNFMMGVAAADVEQGIVVGTGTGAESNTDYKLGTLINDGNGAGQLEYMAQDYGDAAVVGANVDWPYRRCFHNDSGGSITVEEVGIYVATYCVAGVSDSKVFCIARDLTGGDAIADGKFYAVLYTFRTTV